ncbi:MAG: hypothetical protein ACREB7_08640 [Sphingopyxis sp.]|uniref:hypothetical protein n=1 Tax=Sphingopyxis sp. TaxID=1908224 RepID=UPI003D6D32B3
MDLIRHSDECELHRHWIAKQKVAFYRIDTGASDELGKLRQMLPDDAHPIEVLAQFVALPIRADFAAEVGELLCHLAQCLAELDILALDHQYAPVCAPVLQQMASPFAGAIDFYTALRDAEVPAQISLYPGEDITADETHLFHIPSNRLRAMRENMAWFDFWLRGRRDPNMAPISTYDRWSTMATQWRDCSRPPSALQREPS